MSQFLNNNSTYCSENYPEIDFDQAVKLPEGGSTCHIYRTKWQRHEVFIKRLKEQFRSKPLYLDALEKEFEIGVNFNHPGLPQYLGFHRDYIVMEYVDGMTLADMISCKDLWLADKKHITQMMKALVEVVDYLHRHNVVHCDIKPDNILITTNGKNLVLIDFDKCYTDALNDTSGHPGRYGLTVDQKGRTALDYRGIALVAESLIGAGFKFNRYTKFIQACNDSDADCEKLLAILEAPKPNLGLILTALLPLIILIGGAVYMRGIVENAPPAAEPAPRTQSEIHSAARTKAAFLDERIQVQFDELHADIDRLITLKDDTTLTAQQLLDNIRLHSDRADEYITEAFAVLQDMYPGITEREAWRVMSYSRAYTGYKRRFEPFGNEYRQEMDRRFAREGTAPL